MKTYPIIRIIDNLILHQLVYKYLINLIKFIKISNILVKRKVKMLSYNKYF